MKKIKIALAFFSVLLMLTCSEDDNWNTDNPPVEQENPTDFSVNFGNQINARFIGKVINEEGNPISGATISIGTIIATTDSNGIFSVTEASVFEKFAYIKASKDGFIDGSRAVVPSSGVNQVTIMLLDLDTTATISSGETSTVDLPDGTQVVFDGNFETAQGGSYSGAVNVTLKHLDVDNSNMELQMPGMLFAEDANGSPRVLETYGMIAVELRSASGEELNLAQGSTAQVSIPLPTSVTNTPNTIPLWSFDEEGGYWKEDGEATLQGGSYVGNVSHFSFWNWDYDYPAITLCITLTDPDGNELAYTPLDLYSPALGSTGTYGYTNAEGVECGLVPQDDELTLTVPSFGCVSNAFTTTIGPFSTDQDITIQVTDSDALITNFIGEFNDCSGNPITNGYMQLFYNDSTHTIPIDAGILDLTIDYCSDNTTYSALVVDLLSNQTTDVTTGNFEEPTTDLGSQMSCIDLTDTDGDGVFDIDEDINGDGNLDNDDTDDDGIPNYLDEDDDGDGVNTADEDRDNDGDPTNDDSDGDQIPDYLDNLDVTNSSTEIFAIDCNFDDPSYDLTFFYESQGLFPNQTFTYYESLLDAENNTNQIVIPENYTNFGGALDLVYVRALNILSGQSSISEIYLLGLGIDDNDQDGLTNCEELTGIDIPDPNWSNCDPNGNITDPNDPDSDDDGFDDCVEAQNGTDPNDPASFPDLLFNCCNNNSLNDQDINTINNPNMEVNIPEVITPNGDGINDSFLIWNIELYPGNILIVYNDQDQIVFEDSQYDNVNDLFYGVTNTGIEITDGTYRYELTFVDQDGNQNLRNGFVCIVTQSYPDISFQDCNVEFDPLLN